MRNKIVALLFLCAGFTSVARGGTIASVGCARSSPTNSGTGPVSATCSDSTAFGSGTAAQARTDYGDIQLWAASRWAFNCPTSPNDCHADAGANGEFLQTATFLGNTGPGTLVVSYFYPPYDTDFPFVLNYLQIDGGQGPGHSINPLDHDYHLSVPIVFGIPVTIHASARTYVSDTGFFNEFYGFTWTGMQVFDAGGTQVGNFATLIQADSPTYLVASPEPGSPGLAVFGLLTLAFMASGSFRSFRRTICAQRPY